MELAKMSAEPHTGERIERYEIQHRRELVVNPCRVLYVAAVLPLARQHASRFDKAPVDRRCQI
jgi:hypothetical protein